MELKSILQCPFLKWRNHILFKTEIIIKLTVLLITLLMFNTVSVSQAQTVNLKLNNVTLDEALKRIRVETGTPVMYKESTLKNTGRVNVDFKGEPLESALKILLKDQPVTYDFSEGVILILPKISSSETNPKAKSAGQQKQVQITGSVKDTLGNILSGVSIFVKNKPDIGTTTDLNGNYILKTLSTETLVFKMVGYGIQEIPLTGRLSIDVIMAPSSSEIDEVVVTAFGQRTLKESVVGAITTVNPKELRTGSSNITTALQGRVAGMISFQRSGEPGLDNADFFIRGIGSFGVNNSPLILVDNMEVTANDLARIPVDDIASFSVLKDATAAAVYGSRGANGVLLITTKMGKEGPASLNFRVDQRLSSPTERIRIADPVTWMKMQNEAYVTRDPLFERNNLYSPEKIARTALGEDPNAYPAVDWMGMLIKDNTNTQNYNLAITGGSQIAQYNVSGNLTRDFGLIKVDPLNNFNNNVDFKVYNLRSNINVNVTKTTTLTVRSLFNLQDYNGPIVGGADAFRNAIRSNPVLFQPVYRPGNEQSYIKHPMFGNAEGGQYLNSYAEVVKGYQNFKRSNILLSVEIGQQLSSLVKGLRYRGMLNITRNSFFAENRQYKPFYYEFMGYDALGSPYYNALNPDGGTEYLDYKAGGRTNAAIFRLENQFLYDQAFEKNSLSGMLLAAVQDRIEPDNATPSLLNTLPYRNVSLSGRFTYSYDKRYSAEFNFGYNGSERFASKNRWGFFPSAGVAWNVHNEKFMESFRDIVSLFKLRYTYGIVGNDVISATASRFFYLSNVELSSAAQAYTWGTPGETRRTINGININQYQNNDISWEISRQSNLGMELSLWNSSLKLSVDYFNQKRSNIVQTRASIPSTAGYSANVLANVGKYSSKGLDAELNYSKSVNQNLWFQARSTLSYATGRYDVYEEPQYEYPYLSRLGLSTTQQRGYIAERLFIDDDEVRNSPVQTFSEQVMGGDIKYLDVNKDGVINSNDMLPIGLPTTPQINYGFGLSTGYKGFDFSFFFSGMAQTSLFINPEYGGSAPFGDMNAPNAVLQVWADSYWSTSNQNPYALWPRLSINPMVNNTQTSTFWMRNGNLLRLKQVELGYELNPKFTKRYKFKKIQDIWQCNKLVQIQQLQNVGSGIGRQWARISVTENI
ncbi:TonB-linked outer membrane protein, SusC/RagA family [Sphingobacterium spiritivorum]|uniref:TonB-linked outer membrane protein, SusC/RagA family n=1 Tax=Sphingobacterium spiritivorum TaxID=258 RepID=A0A380BRE7_SPHSI|nr:TonB-dependent receptor [Sphingobacterium spiritivorum]SUJ04563.1 TonB-linked outer membrane protein, SusC/RagA family [Sphingobacterium spiritivorum]